MNEIRWTFWDAALVSRTLMASKEIEDHWDAPSALPQFAVRGLCGHLVRATTSVAFYLTREVPHGVPVSTRARYYAEATGEPDIASEIHAKIRAKGEEMARAGQAELLARYDDGLKSIRSALDREPEDRKVLVYRNVVLLLDDYLATRVVELAVHIDDLAVSIGSPTPEIPALALSTARDVLIEVARLRHGDLALVRALARRERDEPNALRVL